MSEPIPYARLRLLYELGCEFVARHELEELVPMIVRRCRRVLEAEGAAVLLLDETGETFTFPYASQTHSEVAERLRDLRFPATEGIAGLALRERRSLQVDDVAHHPAHHTAVSRATGMPIRAMLTVPLFAARGPLGVLQVVNPRRGSFAEGDLAFLEALSGSVAVAIDNAWLYARLRESEASARAEVGVLRRELPRRTRFPEIVGASRAIREVLDLVESAAPVRLHVLVRGETGTGKELVAHALHRAGPRADRPFVPVNCTALPEGLLESDLFGPRRGAFTGAVEDRQGVFEAAAGGMVFLDEISELSATAQAKLLRVLEEGEIVRLGETRSRPVNVRVVAATNLDLDRAVAAGSFRQDLFYRVSGFSIVLPPVRERGDDVVLLAGHFLARAAEAQGRTVAGLAPDAVERLLAHDWPGNVREIRNELERAVAVMGPARERIHAADFSAAVKPSVKAPAVTLGADPASPDEADSNGDLREARARFEAELIARALRLDGGNVSAAARRLGLSRVMLHKKVRRYGLGQLGRGPGNDD